MPAILSLQQASLIMGVSEMTVRRYIKSGKLKATMMCNRYIINQEDIPKQVRTYTKKIS